MPRPPVLNLLLLLTLVAWLPLGCAHQSEGEAAGPAQSERADSPTGAEAADSTALLSGVGELPESAPMGPFGYSMIASEDGGPEPLCLSELAALAGGGCARFEAQEPHDYGRGGDPGAGSRGDVVHARGTLCRIWLVRQGR